MPDETPIDIDVAGLLAHQDPLRDSGDVEIDIPLHAIDACDWNPKPPIFGVYRRGLSGSLGEFSLRDRLKAWPNPKSRGRYIVLDGNQRLDVVREMVEDHLASKEAARRLLAELEAEGLPFDPEAHKKRLEATFKAVDADAAFMADVRARVASYPVPCRVLADLDLAGAKLFVATWDRNRSKFDEVKLAGLADEVMEARKADLAERGAEYRKRLEAMTRPERCVVAPASVALPPPPPPAAPPAAPTEDEPWGPPPSPPPDESQPATDDGSKGSAARPAASSRSAPVAPLVPVMFAFTAEAHAELSDGLLRTTARIIRCKRLEEAVERFNACSPDADLSEMAAEVALVCLQRRIAVAESAGE